MDRRVAGDLDVLEAMGDGEIVGRAREVAYELDPVSFVERRRRAEADRRVSLRPAPDMMSQLSALLPVKDGVAVWAVLAREADRRRGRGRRTVARPDHGRHPRRSGSSTPAQGEARRCR